MLFGKSKTMKILNESDGQDAVMQIDELLSPIYYKNPLKLSLAERNIVYIEELEREINNGGFDQFFENSAGDNAIETKEALIAVKSKVFLGLLETAMCEFPNSSVPKDRIKRGEMLENIRDKAGQKWEELDNRFIKYEEDIYSLLLNYVRENIAEFR